MSRHRYVKNIDIHEELDDDAISDGGDDLSPEDHERMQDGLEQVRATLGSEEHSGISDHDIQDALYYYEFDIQQSINWLLEDQERKNVAKQRKGKLAYLTGGSSLSSASFHLYLLLYVLSLLHWR
ncbi:hypothetical protein AcV7_008317 [Taiwanofungus camphoratus]|nr:hypothetical protein AcV7_008317 [Antrodia cinnamomea]